MPYFIPPLTSRLPKKFSNLAFGWCFLPINQQLVAPSIDSVSTIGYILPFILPIG